MATPESNVGPGEGIQDVGTTDAKSLDSQAGAADPSIADVREVQAALAREALSSVRKTPPGFGQTAGEGPHGWGG